MVPGRLRAPLKDLPMSVATPLPPVPPTPESPDAEAPRPGLKARLKRSLQARPGLWSAYWNTKQQIKRVAMLRYFLYDMRHTYRAMFWPTAHTERRMLSAELLFQYHKLEKGLVMPGPRRLFGVEPAMAVMALLRRWIAAGHARTDPVYLGALETLHAYRERLVAHALDPRGSVLPIVERVLRDMPERAAELATPRPLPPARAAQAGTAHAGYESFAQLAEGRRSVRDFLPEAIDAEIVAQAVAAAQLAPSACNRQPCRVFVVSDPERKRELLSFQNGNRGFGHLIPHVAIVTADEEGFFDASERHEPYIDGGLFAMSFILALRDLGVSSCCLNWCVPPENDRQVHRRFALPASQRIVMLIGFGKAAEDVLVPRSPRRARDDVLHFL